MEGWISVFFKNAFEKDSVLLNPTSNAIAFTENFLKVESVLSFWIQYSILKSEI